MHLLREQEEKLSFQKKIAQLEEEKESAETKRLELEQALEEFVRSTDKKGKLATLEKKASLDQGTVPLKTPFPHLPEPVQRPLFYCTLVLQLT